MDGNENNLDMSLFQDADLELNLELPEIDMTDINFDDEDNQDDVELNDPTPPPGENIEEDNLGEGDDPEVVAEEEGQEGEESQDNSPIYSSFATVLSEQGLLPSVDLQNTKIENVDDLTNVFKTEIANQVRQELINKVGEDGVEALEKGITLAELQAYNQTTEALESITAEQMQGNIELAKQVILQDYINQGIDQARAMRILNKSIDAGEDALLEDAMESLESIKAYEQLRLEKVAEERQAQQAAFAKEQEKIDNDLKNSIYKSDEYIKDIKVSKAMQDRVYQSITKIVGMSPDGIAENKLMQQRRENPIEFDTKLYYLYELTNGFSDFSKLVTKSASKATTQLERALRQNRFESGGNPSFTDDPESYGGIGSELVI